MRIGMLIPEFPGQTHSFFWREIVALRRHGIETRILSTRLPSRPVAHDWVVDARAEYLFPLSMMAALGALPGVAIGLPRLLADAESRRLLARPRSWGMLVFAARLVKLCRAAGINHLHVHSCANSALVAAMASKIGGTPYSLTLHGAMEDYGGDQGYKWRNAAFVFTVSETLKEDVARIMPDVGPRIGIAPMGVDTDRFRPAPDARKTQSPFRWFMCARLNPGKGFDVLLDAVARLAADHDFEIRVAGEDEEGGSGYRKTLEANIARLGLDRRITLLGALPQEGVLAELQQATAFVLPSLHEALGVAYMEAMACELPVVGTRTGGVPELVDDGVDGLLVPPGDVEGLVRAMSQVMSDGDLRARLGRAARQKIVSSFGASRSADAMAAALRART